MKRTMIMFIFTHVNVSNFHVIKNNKVNLTNATNFYQL